MSIINRNEIYEREITISSQPIRVDEYDMYYLVFRMKDTTTKRVRVFCEKNTFPKLDSKEFKDFQKKWGQNIIQKFFINRLLGEKGLMKKESRDDYIYMGGILGENGCIATRFMKQPNGKTGQDNFDNKLFSIRLKVQNIENPNIRPNNGRGNSEDAKFNMPRSVKKGKTYVVGDIHGMYGSYLDIMNRMHPEDHIIFLGDVIDRGKDGIRIIKDIIKRKQDKKNNPEITFLLGNHEMQFIDTLTAIIRNKLNKQDLENIRNRKAFHSKLAFAKINKNDPCRIQNIRQYEEKYNSANAECDILKREKHLTDVEIKNIENWLYTNRGWSTIDNFLIDRTANNAYTPNDCRANNAEEQRSIILFLMDSYVALPKNINGEDYLLVHAMPPNDEQIIRKMKRTRTGI